MTEETQLLDTQFDPEDEYRPEPEPEPQAPAWMDGSLRVGMHTSVAGSYLNALESARKLGCNALQIFSASPRMWQLGSARIPSADAAAFRARRTELGLGPLVIHANYLINLAAQQPMLRTRSIQAFHDELVREFSSAQTSLWCIPVLAEKARHAARSRRSSRASNRRQGAFPLDIFEY